MTLIHYMEKPTICKAVKLYKKQSGIYTGYCNFANRFAIVSFFVLFFWS